jgi:hypothetical protein
MFMVKFNMAVKKYKAKVVATVVRQPVNWNRVLLAGQPLKRYNRSKDTKHPLDSAFILPLCRRISAFCATTHPATHRVK